MRVEHLEIPHGAVIIIRDLPNWGDADDAELPEIVQGLHEHHPESLVLLLDGDTTLETMDIDMLEQLLKDTIEHKRATAGGTSA